MFWTKHFRFTDAFVKTINEVQVVIQNLDLMKNLNWFDRILQFSFTGLESHEIWLQVVEVMENDRKVIFWEQNTKMCEMNNHCHIISVECTVEMVEKWPALELRQ